MELPLTRETRVPLALGRVPGSHYWFEQDADKGHRIYGGSSFRWATLLPVARTNVRHVLIRASAYLVRGT